LLYTSGCRLSTYKVHCKGRLVGHKGYHKWHRRPSTHIPRSIYIYTGRFAEHARPPHLSLIIKLFKLWFLKFLDSRYYIYIMLCRGNCTVVVVPTHWCRLYTFRTLDYIVPCLCVYWSRSMVGVTIKMVTVNIYLFPCTYLLKNNFFSNSWFFFY